MVEPVPSATSLGVLVPNQDELSLLFAEDPLGMSQQSIDRIIAAYAKKASDWAKDEAAGKTQAKTPRIEGDAKAILAKLGIGKLKS